MGRDNRTKEELLKHIAELERQLAESEETLRAIRNGEVDAIFVDGPLGEQVFTLKGADHTYRMLIENMRQGAVTTAVDGTILYANTAFAEMLQDPDEQILGTSLAQYIAPESRPLFNDLAQRGFKEQAEGEIALLQGGGPSIPAYIRMNRVLLEDEPILCVAITDLREQKRQEEIIQAEKISRAVLERSEELFSKAFNSAPFLMSISSAEDGRFFEVNDTFCRVTGYAREEVIGSTSVDLLFISNSDREMLKKEIAQKGRVHEVKLKLRKKSGELFICLYFAEVISVKEGRRLLSIAEDITEKRRIEADRDRLMTAIDQAGEIVLITDAQGNIQYVNPAFEAVTGYAKEDVVGKNPRILKSGVQDKAFYQDLWETIGSGRNWKGRIVNRRKDGSRYTQQTCITPVVDVRGAITNFVAVKRDITEEIETEKRLIQAQKMESIGTLAGGIAHDFNNILSPIIMDSEIAMMELSEDSPVQTNLKRIYTAGERARDLVRQILSFARGREKERMLLKASLVVKEGVKFLRATLPSTINIQTDLSAEQDEILADPTQLHQILMNLCINAAHAMEEEGGTLDIVLADADIGPESGERFVDLKPGGYLRLSVADTGKGIAPDVLEKMFDPYFTTKPVGKGTGMGLTLIHNIVRNYEGTIAVASELGRGSRFEVYLPLAEGEDRRPESAAAEAEIPGGDERILLVDDEESILSALVPVLERYGYHVTAHTSSTAAIQEFRNDPGAYDLVITDMTMPQITGKQLAQELMGLKPGIPIILCTGFSEAIDEKAALEMGIKGYLMKPLVLREVLRKVREVLGR
jgi:PAS domain S-box-containing protein